MEPVVDHLQVTVRDFVAAVAFYDRLMPLLGFEPGKRASATIAAHDFQVVEYSHPRLAFAITSPRQSLRDQEVHRRRPGALHHLAFRVGSREAVDALHRQVDAIGATIVSPPREYPEYKPPGYYALFFKDPDGIKYEIVTHSECKTAGARPRRNAAHMDEASFLRALEPYYDAFAERDRQKRLRLLAAAMTPDAEIWGPGRVFAGYEQISEKIDGFHRNWPQCRLVLTTALNIFLNSARLGGAIVGPADDIRAEGQAVVELAADGRINRVIPFWEALSALPVAWPRR